MSYESYLAIADECKSLDRPDLALALNLLSQEYLTLVRKARVLDEIVADSAEEEKITYISRVPERRRFVPVVIEGGAA